MDITAKMVKELRAATGAGVLDCRNALVETKGNLDEAVDILRQKGLEEAQQRKEREANEGVVATYVHSGSRIAAMVELNCETDFVAATEEFQALAKELTMQVAASSPIYVTSDDIPQDVVAKQAEAYQSEMEAANKPPHILERIVSGKMQKFYEESCLLEQPYIRDTDISVGELIDRNNATLGENISVRRFVRYELGK